MATRESWKQGATPRRMEQAGWQPVLAPVRLRSPSHRHAPAGRLVPLLTYLALCAAIVAAIALLLHVVTESLW
jgi:hypothetical protein